MHNQRTIFLMALALTLLWSFSAFAAASPKYNMDDMRTLITKERLIDGGDETMGAGPRAVWGRSVAVGNPPPGSPGWVAGTTTYDYQHNGSTGRQVDVANNKFQLSWMRDDDFDLDFREVWYAKGDVGGFTTITLDDGRTVDARTVSGVSSVPALTSADRAGYTTYRNLFNGGGRGVVFGHDAPQVPENAPVSGFAATDAIAYGGFFTPVFYPQPAGFPADEGVIWPKGDCDVVGTDTILHMTARANTAGDYDPIYYFRGWVDSAGTSGVQDIRWETPYFIDSTADISPVIEQDPNSDKVALVYTKVINMDYTGGAAQVFCDVLYFESTDGGVTWPVFPDTVFHQDTLQDGNFAYTDVDALYDEDGTLHVLYNTRAWFDNDDDGERDLLLVPAGVWHWNDVRQTNRLITTADWENECNLEDNPFDNGAWNLMVSKGNISVKPAGVAGISDEIFYAVWVQAGPTDTLGGVDADCATQSDSVTLGGMVNAELYCSASSDDGLTWDRPFNLTGTRTPDCTPGNCHSEHWVTAAARADSALYLSYVDDTHAGGVIQEEGAWSLSSYMVYAPRARTPVLEPRIAVTPQNFVELNVPNDGSFNDVQVTVSNLGNSTLNWTVEVIDGLSHVLVDGGLNASGSIVAAGAAHTLNIQYEGTGELDPSEFDWRLEVTSNDQTNDPGQGGSPIDINLNVFVANTWFTCASAEFDNGQRNMSVNSCLATGDQGGGGGLFGLADSTEWLFEASPVITFWGTGPAQQLSWVDLFWSNVSDRSRDSNRAFRAQSGVTVQTGQAWVSGDSTYTANIATGMATTTDTTIDISWQVVTFDDPHLTDGFVATYVATAGRDVAELGDGIFQFGAAADLDVDSMSAFNDGIVSESRQYVGVQGGFGDEDLGAADYTPENKWAALFYVPLDSLCDDQGEGAQVLDNPVYVYPEGNYNPDSLRLAMGRIVGWSSANFPVDTVSDLNVIMKHGEIITWTSTSADTARWAFGVAVSDISVEDLGTKISALRSAVNAGCVSGCLIQVNGDVNVTGSVTSADIIYLVNFVFKGDEDPQPCQANGDVNCTGSVTSADIIFLVNFVFKGDDAPCDICNESPIGGTCT